MFRKTLSFFHLLNLAPHPANAVPSLSNAVIPAAKAEQSDRMPAVLEHGNYSILDAKGHILVGHITLPDCQRLAPDIAKSRQESVRILHHA